MALAIEVRHPRIDENVGYVDEESEKVDVIVGRVP